MTQQRHELFDELEAFDPKWQTHYPTLLAAAKAARAEELFCQWLSWTAEGNKYAHSMNGVPDYSVKRADARSLPYSLDNIGEVPDDEAEGEGLDQAGDSGPVDWTEQED